MSNRVRRVYVEKKKGFDGEACSLYNDLSENLGLRGLTSVRVVRRYDMAGMTDEEYAQALHTIFSEPPVDNVYEEQLAFAAGDKVFALEYLPGQYDQRADSAAQCVQLLSQRERPLVSSATVIILSGKISDNELQKIKNYLINPVETREAALTKPDSLEIQTKRPPDVEVLHGFIAKTPTEIASLRSSLGLAMSLGDLLFCQEYFRDTEKRDPSITEIRVIDTYWSDHCRHTTFLTKIEDVKIEQGLYNRPIATAYTEYCKSRETVYGDQPKTMCLMDIALIGMKELRRKGCLPDLEESDEINACSIIVNVDVDGQNEEWLVQFKNETHNHPTEIEPYGGAATCLGGAIRDPLSGRSYVYQALRVTGSADPRTALKDTLPGKLAQRKITTGAAAGFSSYGNQIGLATGQVAEVYHGDFVAKRMEVGAVIAAAPRKNVLRAKPQAGDVIILLGGRTGRDGCGGATGSSKEHTEQSILLSGAEVQKGNAPTERKLQRLFRNPAVSVLIKKCNDFGAGGVSVAIGELADALLIDLDAVPKKYEGLDGTELAISESQERMAVVVARENAQTFINYAGTENLEATIVARVTDNGRLRMLWRGTAIVDISRDFLNTNGVQQQTRVTVTAPGETDSYFRPSVAAADLRTAWLAQLGDLNICSQKGLAERFDSSIGTGTVLMPFGGRYQLTPVDGMVAKIPVLTGDTTTGTIMTYGYNPALAKWSPFHGALYAVIEAVAKVVALGGNYQNVRLTLQEYFEKLDQNGTKWGKPFSALLGAYWAQNQLGIPAIGGKDSMSGTFRDINVPPTLVAFAVDTVDVRTVISPEFKKINSQVVLIPVERDENAMPDFVRLKKNFAKITELIQTGSVLAAYTVKLGGLAAAISKMTFGNRIGMNFSCQVNPADLFAPDYGSMILEVAENVNLKEMFGAIRYQCLGSTQRQPVLTFNGLTLTIEEMLACWEKPLDKIFPVRTASVPEQPRQIAFAARNTHKPSVSLAKPRILIPVFPGTNCEYDAANAFTKAGGIVDTLILRNLSPKDIEASITAMVKGIEQAQIVMLPGGFSAGDEPDGSGKFIAAVFRNPRIKAAVMELLKNRDGLMLGICNGFQALIKLGLVPYGEIIDITADCPTLTFNKINRHVSCMVNTKIISTLSPWFNNVQLGDIHTLPVSHGEGRFVASPAVLASMLANGQIAAQYVDHAGQPTYAGEYNPNGSFEAIEAITSPDGRVLGKMAHSERTAAYVATNIPGDKYQPLFAAGVNYFK